MTNDVSTATVRSPASQPLVEVLARKPSQRAQPSVTPPAAALNLAMQVGDCLLSAGISAKNVVVAMLGIADAYGLCPIVWRSIADVAAGVDGSQRAQTEGGPERPPRRADSPQ
jgi:hypothetical protein